MAGERDQRFWRGAQGRTPSRKMCQPEDPAAGRIDPSQKPSPAGSHHLPGDRTPAQREGGAIDGSRTGRKEPSCGFGHPLVHVLPLCLGAGLSPSPP